MSEKKVVITLGKDGSVKAEAFGFKGSSCTDATQFLNEVFPSGSSMETKASYYEEEVKDDLLDINGLPSGHCG